MKRVTVNIIIGNYFFDYATEIKVVSDWDEFTDICSIKLPKKLEFEGKPIAFGNNPIFKRGDKVTVKIGYHPNLNTEFEGFISEIIPNTPMVIKCEDFMWKLKQASITASYKSVTLKKLLSDLLVGAYKIPFEALNVNLGKFRITKANIVEVFEEIKNKYGLVTFIQNGKLYSGFPYVQSLQNTEKYAIDGSSANIVNASNLIFKREDDVRIQVEAISIGRDNKKTSIIVGDSDGEKRTFNFFNLSKSDLEDTANREFELLKFDGYRGDLEAFGEPFIQHNDIIDIKSDKTPERSGKYLVKRTEFSLTMGKAYKRKIIPDKKVKNS